MRSTRDHNNGSNEMMTVDEFFAEAKRLGCRMHLSPEEQRIALDAKDAEIESLRDVLHRMLEAPTTQISVTWKAEVRQALVRGA